MDLYNADDPNDNILTREEKRWRREQLAKMFQWQEALRSEGANVTLSAKPDFDKAAFDDSLSFLAKFINSISPKNGQDALNVVFNNHYKVYYLPANDNGTEMLHVKDLERDYRDSNQTEAEHAVLEKVRCAVILAHSAKALGWEKVHFADTEDPLSRYILKMVCEELDLKSDSEKIDMNAIPDIIIKDKNLPDLAFTLFKDMQENPESTVARGKYADAAKNDNNQPEKTNGSNDNSFDFDIAA